MGVVRYSFSQESTKRRAFRAPFAPFRGDIKSEEEEECAEGSPYSPEPTK